MTTRLTVLAIGGNSLIKDKKKIALWYQYEAVKETAVYLSDLIEAGMNMVITHGNGPQVGAALIRSERAADQVYGQGKINFEKFKANGWMFQEQKPCFYIYKQIMGSHQQVGLVANLVLAEYQGKNQRVMQYADILGNNYNYAELLVQTGNINQAIEHFREAARVDATSFKALNNLGVLLEKQQRHDEAIYYYQKALKLDPEHAGLHFNIGVALGNKGDLEKAAEHFQKALELNPQLTQARQALNIAREMQKKH